MNATVLIVSIEHSYIHFKNTKSVENIFIELYSPNKKKLYSPDKSFKLKVGCIIDFKADFNSLMSNPGQILIAGDFNAKHRAWNNQNSNAKGKIIHDLSSHFSFNIFPPDNPTLIPCSLQVVEVPLLL